MRVCVSIFICVCVCVCVSEPNLIYGNLSGRQLGTKQRNAEAARRLTSSTYYQMEYYVQMVSDS